MMSKFKNGDLVIREGRSFGDCLQGCVYTVDLVSSEENSLSLKEFPGKTFTLDKFKLDTEAEKDPTGRDAHAPGAKLDAGKLRPSLVLGGFAHALASVVRVGSDGAAKYTDNGWKEVPNGFARYREAHARHDSQFLRGQTHDTASKSLHLAHVAWNALASLELYLAQNPQDKEAI